MTYKSSNLFPTIEAYLDKRLLSFKRVLFGPKGSSLIGTKKVSRQRTRAWDNLMLQRLVTYALFAL